MNFLHTSGAIDFLDEPTNERRFWPISMMPTVVTKRHRRCRIHRKTNHVPANRVHSDEFSERVLIGPWLLRPDPEEVGWRLICRSSPSPHYSGCCGAMQRVRGRWMSSRRFCSLGGGGRPGLKAWRLGYITHDALDRFLDRGPPF